MKLEIDCDTNVACAVHGTSLDATFRIDLNTIAVKPCPECVNAAKNEAARHYATQATKKEL